MTDHELPDRAARIAKLGPPCASPSRIVPRPIPPAAANRARRKRRAWSPWKEAFLSPEQARDPKPPARRPFVRLLGYVRPYVPLLLVSVLFAVALAGVKTGRALLIMPFWDQIVVPQMSAETPAGWSDWTGALSDAPAPAETSEAATRSDESAVVDQVREQLPRLLWATLALLIALPISNFGQVYVTQYLLGRILVDIQQRLCSKLLGLPLGFHVGGARGETLSRVMNDAQRSHLALEQLFAEMLPAVILMGAGVTALLFISWQLSIALLVLGPLVAGVIATFGRRIRKNARRRQESQADVTQRLLQILSGIKVIKAFSARDAEEAAFAQENDRYFRRNMRVVKFRAFSQSAVEAINNSLGVVFIALGFGAVLAGVGELTMGRVFAFVVVMQGSCYRPLKQLTKSWTKLQEAAPSAERFFELLDLAPESRDAPDATSTRGPEQGIRIDKLSFSYGREAVLHDVSVDIAAGDVVAIVGRTGSGKTTLADLLLRFYDPDAGAIEIDGVDLRAIRRESWLSRVAVVTQDPFLFSGTIRDNIRYGRPDASDDEIEAAARVAHVDEFVARLADGYETDVGEAGAQLSGGQRQRITIARAVLRDPRVLIFDEATSSLDAQSERYVQEAIESLLGGRTVFIIAHRLSTVRHADKILVLDEGTLAATGTHDELMARGGLYADLMSLQQAAPTA